MDSNILSYRKCSDAEIVTLIKLIQAKFPFSCEWTIEKINLKRIIPLCKHVYSERLNFAKKNISKCSEYNIPLFYPYVVQYKDEKKHLVVPPIVEEREGKLFLGDGMHRVYSLLGINTVTAYVLVTHNCTLPLPGKPQSWDNVKEITTQLPGHLNFENFLREGLTGYSKFCNSDIFWTYTEGEN